MTPSRPGGDSVATRGFVLPAGLLCLLAALLVVPGLRRPAITDSDEAYYAEAAREMVESGDYLTPRFNYANRFQKPVLYYWMAAASYGVAGVSAATARFPSALAGVGLVWLAFAMGPRWWGREEATLAAAIVGQFSINSYRQFWIQL